MTHVYDHRYMWGNNSRRAELKGRLCRIIAGGTKNTILIEFEDGTRVTTSGYAVRLANPPKGPKPQPVSALPAGGVRIRGGRKR